MVIRLGKDIEAHPISGESETVRAGENVAISTLDLGGNVCVCGVCVHECARCPGSTLVFAL